ncbi:hypothetical protein KB206_01585 [Microvirga sp. STS02]|uniref:hypothetical protein n=1 Tax=Hymenobacter negativus TaxID=2795026 RepID=UPI0018DC1C7B|nr:MULTISPECIES: hypothetical protein [Bacteria]MBH8567558.1 hypothetical protein [Hymenobacter negativus]MBR7207290.1 hypothetical protein [Microvirga sp. STS02]
MTFPLDYTWYSAQPPSEQVDWFDELEWESIADVAQEKSIRKFLEAVYEQDRSNYTKLKALEWYSELTLGKVIPSRATRNFLLDATDEDTSLQVAKLKYLFLLFGDDPDVTKELDACLDSEDEDVSSEAYYRKGLLHLLYRAGQSDEIVFFEELELAKQYFNQAIDLRENRVDALFFSLVTQCLEQLLAAEQGAYTATFHQLDNILWQREVWGKQRESDLFEWHIYRSLVNIRGLAEHSAKQARWLDIHNDFVVLAKYANDAVAIQSLSPRLQNSYQQFTSTLVPYILDEYYVNNLSACKIKIDEQLSQLDEADQTLAPFLITLKASIKAGEQKKSPETSLTLLSQFKNAFPEISTEQVVYDLKQLLTSIDSEEGAYLKLFLAYRAKLSPSNRNPLTKTGSPIGDEVLNAIVARLHRKLPNYPNLEKSIFLDVLGDLITYAVNAEMGETKDYEIYYDSAVKAEEDFQRDLYKRLRITQRSSYYRMEVTGVGSSGRIDILYQENTTLFPIEVKRESIPSSWDDIEKYYVPQAQMYTTPYNQLGFLVIFEISPKKGGASLPDFRDRFAILHHKPTHQLGAQHPDYIVAMVVPANRVTPSKLTRYKS